MVETMISILQNRARTSVSLSIALSICVFLGCSGRTEECLKKSIETYYSSIEESDFGIAYDLENSIVRESISRDQYIENAESRHVVIDSFAIGKVEVLKDRARVEMKLIYVLGEKSRESKFYDAWIIEDGKWRHAPN